ncbi:MAG: hypothetical protein ACE15D_00010 [Candidatus Eisenbacteria bacterium]
MFAPTRALAAVGLTLLVAGCADVKQPVDAQRLNGIEPSPFSAYQRYGWMENREIPDGDRKGTLIGPVFTDGEDAELGLVILKLAIRHQAPGDLDIWLAYDADRDGKPEVHAPIEFFRSRQDVWAEERHACPAALEGAYLFRNGRGWEEMIFEPFHGLPRGGAFYLSVADTLAGDRGTVLGWAIYLEEAGS